MKNTSIYDVIMRTNNLALKDPVPSRGASVHGGSTMSSASPDCDELEISGNFVPIDCQGDCEDGDSKVGGLQEGKIDNCDDEGNLGDCEDGTASESSAQGPGMENFVDWPDSESDEELDDGEEGDEGLVDGGESEEELRGIWHGSVFARKPEPRFERNFRCTEADCPFGCVSDESPTESSDVSCRLEDFEVPAYADHPPDSLSPDLAEGVFSSGETVDLDDLSGDEVWSEHVIVV